MEKKTTIQQRKLFFALARNLGIETEEAKERAKRKFHREHLADLTVEEMTFLIDAMQTKIEAEMIKCPTCVGTGYIKKEILEVDDFNG